MAEIQAGITALITAYARAYHAAHDSPLIFDDSLAGQYYTPEEHTQFDQNLAAMLPMVDPELAATHPDQAAALAVVMQTMHCPVTLSRSRFCEDRLTDAIRQGARQYVILGAGLDTFAWRRPELLPGLRVFELDHPVTQAMKRERIAYAGWMIPEHLFLVPIDLSRERLADGLLRAGFDPAVVSFFSWLGVSFYLPREVVFDILRSIAALSAPGSTVVFDYMDPAAFDPAKAAPRTTLMHAIARQVGEPMKSGFDPLALADDLLGLGWDLRENPGPKELDAVYFQGRADRLRAFEHVHITRAVRV